MFQSDIQLHGSLLIQHLLRFKKVKLILASIMNFTESELCQLACHNVGSRILDAFFISKTISLEQKRDILDKLRVKH